MAGQVVGIHEMTEMFMLSRRRIDQLTRQEGFPQPVFELHSGRIWRRSDVVLWASVSRYRIIPEVATRKVVSR